MLHKHLQVSKVNECIFLAAELTNAFTTLKTLNESTFFVEAQQKAEFLEAAEMVVNSLQEQINDLIHSYKYVGSERGII